MRFKVIIIPDNKDRTQDFDLGEIEASSRTEVVDELEDGDFIPAEYDYHIIEIA